MIKTQKDQITNPIGEEEKELEKWIEVRKVSSSLDTFSSFF